jgi:hypothetical protein
MSDNDTEKKSSMEEKEKDGNLSKAMTVVGVILALDVVAFITAIVIAKVMNKWKNFWYFLNGDQKFTIQALILGTISAAVFGFIDNAAMFFGIDALSPYLPGGELTQAGWGNTFSSAMGSLMSSSISKIITHTTGFQGGPIYAETIGMVIGTIVGIYIPKAITGKE